MGMRISLEIFLLLFIPSCQKKKKNIKPTLLVYFIQKILTTSKAGLFTNLSTLLKQ